jgi:hypothetical protein
MSQRMVKDRRPLAILAPALESTLWAVEKRARTVVVVLVVVEDPQPLLPLWQQREPPSKWTLVAARVAVEEWELVEALEQGRVEVPELELELVGELVWAQVLVEALE